MPTEHAAWFISFEPLWKWLQVHVFNEMVALQAIVMFSALAAGSLIAQPILKALLNKQGPIYSRNLDNQSWFEPLLRAFSHILPPFISLVLLYVYWAGVVLWEFPGDVIEIAINLLTAWIVIRFISFFIVKRFLAKWLALFVWSIAALNIAGQLERTIETLDAVAIKMNDKEISLLFILKGVIIFALLIWGALVLTKAADRSIRSLTELTPSLRVLLSKLTRILLMTLSFLVGLNVLGIDLTALAVFGGAVGIGLGFGLQKVVSNFISGLILLMDRSIKPGDVIAIGQTTYGWVNSLGARHVSVITRDGKEHLIPNEQLITEKVENWSYSNNDVRLHIPVGISYDSDVDKATELMLEAIQETPRVLKHPAPRCLLLNFGESAIEFELRLWINDPPNGMGIIRNHILRKIWKKFKKHDIEIPYPKRDVQITNPVKVTLAEPTNNLPLPPFKSDSP